MNMSPKEYNRYVARLAKKSPLGKDLLNSFLIGGLICVIGQLILNGYTALELSEQDAAAATSVSLVFLSAVLTGLSVYDDLAKLRAPERSCQSLASQTRSSRLQSSSKPRASSPAWRPKCSSLLVLSLSTARSPVFFTASFW